MNREMNKKLLPCPFCGGEAELFRTHEKQYCIMHGHTDSECVIDTGERIGNWVYDELEEAMEHWNTRKPMERIVERLEERKQGYLMQYEYTLEMISKQAYECYDDAVDIVKEEGGLND